MRPINIISISGQAIDRILEEENLRKMYFGLDDLIDRLGLQGKVMVSDSLEWGWGFDFFFEDPKDMFLFLLRYSHIIEEEK